eukprot:GILJ01010054.1.p1 GENE.GILJ01010054.1~~GILJ01010054.1.p1  ORF type:complete len:1338 (-),score=194.37 GILJ01010054.1:108-3893(-)
MEKLARDGFMREFDKTKLKLFVGSDDFANFFHPRERHRLVERLLLDIVGASEEHPFSRLWKLQKISIIPLHDQHTVAELMKASVSYSRVPIDQIASYFGTKVAFYFAWLDFYLKWLVAPALAGLVTFLLQQHYGLCNVYTFAYALFLSIWATLFTEFWKRRNATLAYGWGVFRMFEQYNFPSNLTSGATESDIDPFLKIVMKYALTVPATTFLAVLVWMYLLAIFELERCLIETYGDNFLSANIPTIFYAASLPVVEQGFDFISRRLTDFEKHSSSFSFEEAYNTKRVVFYFVNSFSSLFYIAFVLQDLDKLRCLLGTIFVTRQIIGNVREVVIPYYTGQFSTKSTLLLPKRPSQPGPPNIDKKTDAVVHASAPKLNSVEEAEVESEESTVNRFRPELGSIGTASPRLSHRTRAQSFIQRQQTVETFSPPVLRQRSTSLTAPQLGATWPDNHPPTVAEEPFVQLKRTGGLVSQLEWELSLPVYSGVFEEYLEMAVQFGYVAFFGFCWPLAAICALANNVIEIRSDGFKLCKIFQRISCVDSPGIGFWATVLETVSVLAVISNCAMLYVYSADVHSASAAAGTAVGVGVGGSNMVVWIIVIEHLVLASKFLIAYVIPDVPFRIRRLLYLEKQSRPSATGGSVSLDDVPAVSAEKAEGHAVFRDTAPVNVNVPSFSSPFSSPSSLKQLPLGLVGVILLAVPMAHLCGQFQVSLLWLLPCAAVYCSVAYNDASVAEPRNSTDVTPVAVELPRWMLEPDVHSVEWFNHISVRLWPKISRIATEAIQENFQASLPSFLKSSITLTKIDFGSRTPCLSGIKVFDGSEREDQLIMDLDFTYMSDFQIDVGLVTSLSWLPPLLSLSEIQISGTLRVMLDPLVHMEPIVGGVKISLLHAPTIDFRLHLLSLLDLMDVYFVNYAANKIIQRVVRDICVWPKSIDSQVANEMAVQLLKGPAPTGMLRVRVVGATTLVKADIIGSSDPYCILQIPSAALLPDVLGQHRVQRFQTTVVYNNLNPRWNETFEFITYEPTQEPDPALLRDLPCGMAKKAAKNPYRYLHITVMDKDLHVHDDFLGELDIDLKPIMNSKEVVDLNRPLARTKTGSIQLELSWTPFTEDLASSVLSAQHHIRKRQSSISDKRELTLSREVIGVLVVHLRRATRLQPSDRMLTVDPYCVLSLSQAQETSSIRQRTLNPVWEETFVLPLRDPVYDKFVATLYDKKNSSCLGLVEVRMLDILESRTRTSSLWLLQNARSGELYMDLTVKLIK